MKSKEHRPPIWADRFLEWYCDPSLLEDLQGDLHERFTHRIRNGSITRAKLLFIWDVFIFLRPYTFRGNRRVSFFFMFRNYFKSAYRSLSKNKLNTSLIVAGLTISISGFILISLYVIDESKFDKHYDKADRIYRVTTKLHSETATELTAWSDAYLGPHLKELYPEVEESVGIVKMRGKTIVSHDGKSFPEELLYRVEKSYFRIFSHLWISGDPTTALSKPRSIVLTKKMANKYFGDEKPIGQSIDIGGDNYLVTGIIKNPPSHSDLIFDGLLSTDKEYLAESTFWCTTFILFRHAADANGFEKKLDFACKKYLDPESAETGTTFSYQMELLTDVHFGDDKLFDTPKGNRSSAYVFTVIALFILCIACVNYVNLSFAQSIKKNVQSGIRKILGAQPSQIRAQQLTESLLLTATSLIFAICLSALLLPLINRTTGKEIEFQQFFSLSFLPIVLFIMLAIGFFAGSFPAIYTSSLNPLDALNGTYRIVSKKWLRSSLVVVQFTACIILMICTKIVFDQVNLLTKSDPGFNKEQILVVDIPNDPSLFQLMPDVKNEFSELPFVRKSSLAGYNSVPTSDMDIDTYEVDTNNGTFKKAFNNISVDEDYIDLFKIGLVEGRNITKEDLDNDHSTVMVNESLVKMMGWKHPFDQTLGEGTREYTIVGVVKDFHFNSFHRSIEPLIIHGSNSSPEKLMVKVDKIDFEKIGIMEKIWKKYLDDQPFTFEFMDTYFNNQYKSEKAIQTILLWFSWLAIVIACLGLFGLVAISTSQRTKEFGIRKILGAGPISISSLIAKQFLMLIGLAAVIAAPISWYGAETWLAKFAYKISIRMEHFLLPILIILAIAFLSMCYHMFKAVHGNAIQSIKHE